MSTLWGVGVLCVGLAGAPDVQAGGGSKFDVGTSCQGDADCSSSPGSPWCSPSGLCTTCGGDEDCNDEDEACIEGACVLPCVEDMDCSAEEPSCNVEQGRCAQCLEASDCLAEEYCAAGFCAADVCSEGQTVCLTATETGICREDGRGYETSEACVAGTECAVEGEQASCVAVDDGGLDTGGAPVGTGGDTGARGSDDGASVPTSGAGDGMDDRDAAGCRSGGSVPGAPASLLLLGIAALRRRRRRA